MMEWGWDEGGEECKERKVRYTDTGVWRLLGMGRSLDCDEGSEGRVDIGCGSRRMGRSVLSWSVYCGCTGCWRVLVCRCGALKGEA